MMQITMVAMELLEVPYEEGLALGDVVEASLAEVVVFLEAWEGLERGGGREDPPGERRDGREELFESPEDFHS